MNTQGTTLPVHFDLVVGDGEPVRIVSGEVPVHMDPQADSIVLSVDPEEMSKVVHDLCQEVIGTPAAN